MKWKLPIVLLFAHAALSSLAAAEYDERMVEGWAVRIERSLLEEDSKQTDAAIALLRQQLLHVRHVVPAAIVDELRKVTLWFSPVYPLSGPHAEYHPDQDWLLRNGRNPEMVKGIEFTNVGIFAAEVRRMPVFVLHELAHAFHDRTLGFDHPEILSAFHAARDAKLYEAVLHYDGRVGKAYAMTDHKEYFAETSEALFGRNDIFPFVRRELKDHDAPMERLLRRLWQVDEVPDELSIDWIVQAPPPELKVSDCYTQYVSASGYPIVASSQVSSFALREAAFLVERMLVRRPDIRDAMVASGSRLCILAHNEFTTDLPEFAHLEPKDFWDARARGTGGSETDPYCSCGEENLLGFSGDPYGTECILIHEFAHNIHLRGLARVDPTFDMRLRAAYEAAKAEGLWAGKYASVNHHEYFAEGVQSWFDNNRPPDHDHNHVDTRAELREYDPRLAALCEEVFRDTELRYTKPATRCTGHLLGYDPAAAPTFAWPARLDETRRTIREQALNRSAK